jgi:hypothetical protein
MPTISVADVDVKYREVEVPEACPMCGARLVARGTRYPAVRELNLASANFYGMFRREGGDGGFSVAADMPEEHPSDAVWIVFGYECVRCGELLATGSVNVN